VHSEEPLVFTEREREVLHLFVSGYSNREIGEALSIEERTVKMHVAKLMRKAGVKNRIALSVTRTHAFPDRRGTDRINQPKSARWARMVTKVQGYVLSLLAQLCEAFDLRSPAAEAGRWGSREREGLLSLPKGYCVHT
jgi:DNA-binding CsgD family transcriptional regulator